ncbi:MAG: translation initiation factor IF-1 [Verrucomicrobia bacterium]|nr:translation initiation factor IF-1 [Verrucomicrobiota bacterium]
MASQDAIRVEGIVDEVLPNRMCRVRLANGHRLMAFPSGRLRMEFVRIAAGQRVTVELSPYDLSKGAVVKTEQTNNNNESSRIH